MASVVWPGRSCPCGDHEVGWRLFPLHVTLLQGSHGWHPGPDRGSRAALRLTRDARLALQAEPGPTPPHPGADAQGHELARLRREPAPARQRDGLVFGPPMRHSPQLVGPGAAPYFAAPVR